MTVRDSIKIFLISFFLLIQLLVISGTLLASESGRNDIVIKQKRFIGELYSAGRYFDCIAETRRLLNLKFDLENRDQFKYFIEGSYFLGGQFKTVIFNLKTLEDNGERLPRLILLSQSYLRLRLYNESIEVLKEMDYHEVAENKRHGFFLRRVEVLLQDSRYEDALTEMAAAKGYLGNVFDIEEMRLDTQRYIENAEKSKWLSVSLSTLVPGAGQVYTGRYLDGAISFLSVLGTLFGAYHFHEKGDRPVSLTFAFFASLFYAGNIYGAYNSAERINCEQERNFRAKLLRKHIPNYSPMNYINLHGIFE